MISNNTRLSTGKPKSENLQRKLLSKPFESIKNEINPFPKILPEISRDDKFYNKTKRTLNFEENCLSKLKNDIIKITNDNHEQGRLDSCLDEIILLTNASNHFKTFLDEVFTVK